MEFTYETLPIEGKEVLREEILRLYNRDITDAPCQFSTRNYAFIFSEGIRPAIIRIGVASERKTAESILTEMMWVDDLRNDVPNVCQPVPSLENKMVEPISIQGKVYLASMFRKANGAKVKPTEWTPEFFYKAAELLGKIHRSSSKGYELGFRYKRGQWDQEPSYDFANYETYFSAEILEDAITVRERIKKIPKDPRWYGMIHGDYNYFNLFYDWDTVWVFDFDDSCYGYFMTDVANLFNLFFTIGYSDGIYTSENIQETMYGENGIYENIKNGYSSQWQLPEDQWDMIDDFMRLRTAQAVVNTCIQKMFAPNIMRAILGANGQFIKLGESITSRALAAARVKKELMTPEVVATLMKFKNG